jgi:hypothetical protein
MAGERKHDEVAANEAAVDRPEAPRLSRRRAIGRMSAVATAAAAAWVAPEILTAKPAVGAVMSGTTGPGTTGASTSDGSTSDGSTSDASTSPGTSGSATSEPVVALAQTLASTGLDLQRDAEIGAAMIAGGWAMQHWASRSSTAGANGAPGSAPDTKTSAPAE